MLHHLAFSDRIDNIGNTRLFVELIFAVLKLATCFERNHSTHEPIWPTDSPRPLQLVVKCPDAQPAWEIAQVSRGRRAARFEQVRADEQSDSARHGDYDEGSEARSPDHDPRVAHLPRIAAG